jgi:hypothetical protein
VSERQIQSAILADLGADSRWRLWRQNSGQAWQGVRSDESTADRLVLLHPRPIKFGLPGMGDIGGLLCGTGQRIEIEVKTETGRQSPDQQAFEAMIRRFGGRYILARSARDVLAAF